MSKPLTASMPADLDLPDGYIVRFNAIDPNTGANIGGVIVSQVSIFGTLLDAGASGGTTVVGPYMLVPGPGA